MYRFADVYLIAAYWLFANILLLTNTLSDEQLEHLRWVYLAPAILSVMHVAGLLTDGYRIENGSPMHNNSALAWVGDAYLIMCLLGVGAIVVSNLKRNDEVVWISKNWVFLFSLIPMVLGFGYVVVASAGPNPVSLVTIGPLMIVWVALTFYYLSRGSSPLGLTTPSRLASFSLPVDNWASVSIRRAKKGMYGRVICGSVIYGLALAPLASISYPFC